jgi:uncharacterized protein (TIRG00374 family)
MKKLSFWIRLVLSVGLIVFLLRIAHVRDMVTIVMHSDPVLLLIAYLLALGDRLLMAYKWNRLLRVKGIQISFLNAASLYLQTSFLGLCLPVPIGADAVRAYAVAKDNHKVGDVIASIVCERLLGFLALLVFALGSIILSLYTFRQTFFVAIWHVFWVLAFLLIMLLAVIYLSLNSTVVYGVQALLHKWHISVEQYWLGRKLKDIYQSYRSYQTNKDELAIFFGLSLLENMLPILVTYCLAVTFRVEVALLYFFILVLISLILIRLPFSVNGLGVQESVFVYFLGLIGVTSSQALLLGATGSIISILSILVGGVLYSMSGLRMRGANKTLQSYDSLEVSPQGSPGER